MHRKTSQDKGLGPGTRHAAEGLRVLLLEENAAETESIREQLRQARMKMSIEQVDSESGFTVALQKFAPDVVISDHSLPHFSAKAALKVLRALRPATPLIIVSRLIDGQTAVACIRAGAEDIVLKHRLGRLASAIEAALLVRQQVRKLTPRQLEVLRYVAQGETTVEIARQLRISAKTVEAHRGALMNRLGIHHVVGLVRYAVRIGLVPPEP